MQPQNQPALIVSGHLLVKRGSKIIYALVDLSDLEKLEAHAWSTNNSGYASATIRGKSTFLHRHILGYKGDLDVDHINRNRLDCRKANLRLVNRSQNNYNSKLRWDNSSGIKGVVWHKLNKRWQAQIQVKGKNIYLGAFIAKQDAIAARIAAEGIYHAK